MAIDAPETKERGGRGIFGILLGLLAMALGTYNLLGMAGVITRKITVPQIAANITLALAGLFLLVTAFRLGRYKYHTRQLF